MARIKPQPNASGHNILVVDDDAHLLQTTARLLQSEGHSVLIAQDGHEALEILAHEAVDVVLLDYFMPNMNGHELVQNIREVDPDIQIVLQTGYASEQPARELLRELDIQGYHDKSEGPEKLLIWIDVAIKAALQARQLRASRNGLAHILRATPEMHRLQPLEDLLRGVLLQLQSLLGLSGFLLTPDVGQSDFPGVVSGSFMATYTKPNLSMRLATGRFSGQDWQSLQPIEQAIVLESIEKRHPQQGKLLSLPLVAGERVMGVIAIDLGNHPDAKDVNQMMQKLGIDLDLIELFANQAAVAIENAQLYELATTDDLTRLATRRHWQQRVDDALHLAVRYQKPLSVMMVDLDHFKQINDTYSHMAGDRVLMEVGDMLRRITRKSDIVGRYGGEEFVIACPFTNEAGAIVLAENLRHHVESLEVVWREKSIHLSASIGITAFDPLGDLENSEVFPLLPESPERLRIALLHGADQAMYQAKHGGRNQIKATKILFES
jgi:two-component system, cell cycle response regulator